MSYDAESLSDCDSIAVLHPPETPPFADVYHIFFHLSSPLHGRDFLRIHHVVEEISGLQNQHCGERRDFKVLLNTFH